MNSTTHMDGHGSEYLPVWQSFLLSILNTHDIKKLSDRVLLRGQTDELSLCALFFYWCPPRAHFSGKARPTFNFLVLTATVNRRVF